MSRSFPLLLICCCYLSKIVTCSRLLLEQVLVSPVPGSLFLWCQSCQHLAAAFFLSLSLSVSLSVSLSGSGMSCHITPNSYAGEAPFAGNFPAHASMCYSQPLCTTFRVREWMQSKTCVPHFTGLWCQKDWRPAGMHPSMGSRLWELAFKCAGPKP